MGNTQTGTSIQWAIHARTWMNLKCILLSARSQTQEATYCIVYSCDNLKKAELQEEKTEH